MRNYGTCQDILKELNNVQDTYLPKFSISGQIVSEQGAGWKLSPRKSVVQSACQYDVTSRVSDFHFKMASKVFTEETDKNFEFITVVYYSVLCYYVAFPCLPFD